MIHDPIRYIALLGPREEPLLLNVPAESLNSTFLWKLGDLPYSMFHFIYGVGQFEVMKKYSLQMGFDLMFMHPDTSLKEAAWLPWWKDHSTPIILFVCTDEAVSIDTYNALFKDFVSEDNVLCVVSEDSINKVSLPVKKVSSDSGIWAWIFTYAYSHYSINGDVWPLSVPVLTPRVIDMGDVFSPSRVNTQGINGILGNWGFRYDYPKEELFRMRAASSEKAIGDKEDSSRQKLLIEQIKRIRLLEDMQAHQLEKVEMMEEQYRAPLILAAPYTNVEMRKPFSNKKGMTVADAKRAKLIEKVLNVDYTKSYTINWQVNELPPKDDLLLFSSLQSRIVSARMEFFDNVALLHSSFMFSPYFRMPILGKNISSELSFVGFDKVGSVTQARTRNQSIRKTMEKVGVKIVSTALCQESVDYIMNDCAQIVAMSDLPVEWMMLDGVPLGFSHDVCRLPETPVQNLLSQYVESKYAPYAIRKDIMEHTLVVYGNDEPAFVQFQEAAESLKSKLGFQTRRCLSKESFVQTIRELKPELLIVDTHGGVDPKTHLSYIMMGNDMLTGEDIVQNHISASLVFLSACNTFPTYNAIGTIANAFFEAGSSAVTTSYMPLEIMPATTLYCRLLNNLSRAATTSIHRNWLSFMSHLLRSSYIHSPMKDHLEKMNPELSKMLAELTTSSMIFHNRRKIYKDLNSNTFTKSLGANYDYIIPHYLMYSTIGRADLIRFQSFMEKMTSAAIPPDIMKDIPFPRGRNQV